MKENITKLINDNQIIMVDTCFAMSDAFEPFLDEIETDLMANGKKILVKSIVMAELYRKMGSSDEDAQRKATRAVSIICMHRNVFEIDEDKVTTEAILKGFADAEIISEFTKNRIHYRMALLTNDIRLGNDILDLNHLASCYGKRVEVFSLSKGGILKEKIDKEPVEDSIREKTVIKKITVKEKDWKATACISVLALFAGTIIGIHGKSIIKEVEKIIAA